MKLFDETKPFYKGNLHTHTTRSDGKHTPEEVMQEYASHGYDFLALTDHWKVGQERRFGKMLVLPGVEYDFTFPTQVLHIVALLPNSDCVNRIARGMSCGEIVDEVNANGGVAIAAHPAWSLNTPDFLVKLAGVEIAEVFNSVSNEPLNARRGDASQILDLTAANGKLYRQVAADDAHFYVGEQCRSYIMLQAEELSVPGILDALRAGRFYATQGPRFFGAELSGNRLIVRTSPVNLCTFSSNQYWVTGRCRVGTDMTENVYEIQPGERFIRCEIADAQGNRAWLSPIAVNGAPDGR